MSSDPTRPSGPGPFPYGDPTPRHRDHIVVDGTSHTPERLYVDKIGGAPSPADARVPRTIWWHGGQCYSVEDEPPLALTAAQHAVLQAFIGHPAHELESLANAVKVTHPDRVMKGLAKKLGGEAIILPGKRGRGGYRADVRKTEGGEEGQ
jgi:hypothetical protein